MLRLLRCLSARIEFSFKVSGWGYTIDTPGVLDHDVWRRSRGKVAKEMFRRLFGSYGKPKTKTLDDDKSIGNSKLLVFTSRF